MLIHQATLTVRTAGQGLYEITPDIQRIVVESRVERGMVNLFCQHTSCSLVIMENADRSARSDLEAWLNRLVPENDPNFQHTSEGPDDMPSHIKMALTRTSETIPVTGGALQLGTWQGIYLWEHRLAIHSRQIFTTVIGE